MKKILTYQDVAKVFDDELKRSKELVSWVDQRLQILQKIDFEKDMLNETNLTIGCLSIAVEHHKAIIELVGKDMLGPAHGLVRVAIESCYRGMWLNLCAKPSDWERFRNDKGIQRQMHKMISDVSESGGPTSSILQDSWDHIGRLPHAGLTQISLTLTRLATDLDNIVVRKRSSIVVLSLVNGVAVVAGSVIGGVLGKPVIFQEFRDKLGELQKRQGELKELFRQFDNHLRKKLKPEEVHQFSDTEMKPEPSRSL